jgi:undecaprenyl-diphosphatase
MNIIEAIILAIVEGLTEFLPVSSTGHMIIASSLMGIAEDPFTKTFTVSIQLGAILSVVVLYYKRFFQSVDFYLKLFVAFIPAAIFGKLLDDYIDSLLGNVLVVGFTLLAGGALLVFIDNFINENKKIDEESETITYKKALTIGLFQCIAMVPGVSRSAATIVGGLAQKLNRKAAAEFSFFLAVPTMFAATGYKLYKFYEETKATGLTITQDETMMLLVGNLVAFIVAMIAIKSFITYLTKHGFKLFGYYRIIVGIIIIILVVSGVDLKVV